MVLGRANAWLLAAMAGLGLNLPAAAADLRLEPVSLTLAPGDDSASLWLSNTGSEPLRAQLRIFAWTQAAGGEVLATTRELAASPPLVEVPARGRQRVRLVRLGRQAPDAETAYRLVVDELPGGAGMSSGTSALRYSLPVFVLPGAPLAPSRLSARVQPGASGPVLRLDNAGGRHARIAELAFVDAGGRRHTIAPGLAGYVLAGRHKTWPLAEGPGPPLPGRVEAEVDGEPAVLDLAPLAGAPTRLPRQSPSGYNPAAFVRLPRRPPTPGGKRRLRPARRIHT